MTLDDVLRALKRAHDAGDEQAARKLAGIATQMADPLKAAEAEIPVRYSLGESVVKGFQRSAKQLGSGVFDTLPALGASALGFTEYAKKQQEEAEQAKAEIARDYPAQFQSYTEVGSPYQALQYAAETLGELGPSAIGSVGPGILGKLLARSLATRTATTAAEKLGPVSAAERLAIKEAGEVAGRKGMYGGVRLGSLAQNVPEVFQNIYEETGEFQPLISGLAGGAIALLDSIVPGQIMSKFGAYGRLKAAEAIIKQSGAAPSVWKAIGKEAALTAGKEGLTESAQESISAAAEQLAGSAKGLLDPENIQRYKEAFVKGAIGGAAFGVVGGAGRGFAEKGEFQAKQERERVAQEEAERQKQLAGEVAASEAQMQGVIDVAKQQPQMELPGMGIGEEYGPASALVPPTVEPTETAPTYTTLANSIAQDLGIKIEKSADPEDMVARIREAVNNYIQAPRTPAVSTASILQTLPAEYQRAISFLNAIDNGSITTSKASPKQLSLLGPQGGVTKAAQKNVLRKITPTELENIRTQIGVAPTAKLFKPEEDAAKSLLGLDLLNPEDAKQAKDVLQAYAENRSPRIQASVQKWITANLDPVITRGAPPDVTGTNQQPSGAGTEVPSGGVAAPPTVSTEQPQPGGVVPSGSDAGKPVAGEGPQQSTLIPPPAAPTSPFPSIKDIPGIQVGPAYVTPKPIAEGKPLFRETNLEGLDALLRLDNQPDYQQVSVTDNPNIALGQGDNRGVYVTFRPDSLSGAENVKPGTGDLMGREYVTDVIAPRAVQSITLPKQAVAKLRFLSKRILGKDFTQTELPNGFIRFDRKGIAPATQVLGPVGKPTPAPKRAALKKAAAVPKRPPEGGAGAVPSKYKPNGDPSDSETAFIESNLSGKSAIEAARWLSQNSPDWDYRVIADRVAKTLEKLQKAGVTFSFNIAKRGSRGIPTILKDPGTRGAATIRTLGGKFESVDVWINGSDFEGKVGTSFQVVLHELIHAATSATLILESHSPSPDIDPKLKAGIARLTDVFEKTNAELRSRLQRSDLTDAERSIIRNTNALDNIREFIAWGLTNRDFQKILESVEYKKTGKSLWSAFVSSIREFLGLPAKADTALAEVLRAAEVVLNKPTKQIAEAYADATRSTGTSITEALNDQSVRFPNLANKLVGPNGLADRVLQKTPLSIMTPARRTDIWRMLEKLALPARSLVYKALNASQMGEVASKYFGNDSIRFATILNEIGGYRQRIEEKLEPLNRQFVVHREKYPERHAALHALMNDATIADVAPYDDAETAKKYKNTTKEATYEALKKRFNNLNAEEKQLYKSAFTSFVALRNEFKKALKGNISELVKDEATALSIYDKIMNELSQVMIDHYFPLYRKGDFRLSYTLNGKAAVERFESQAERAAAQRALEAQGATDIEATSQLNQFNSDNIPDGTMLSAVMKIVKDAGGGKEDLDKVVQLVVSAFPETSILKRQQKRSGIPGYINDNAALVFDSVTSNNARQIATIKYREELKSLMNKMREKQQGYFELSYVLKGKPATQRFRSEEDLLNAQRTLQTQGATNIKDTSVMLRGDASEDAKTMFEDLDGRFRFAMDPDIAGWAQYASSAAFYWNLAANVSSALVQIATVPTVVFPNLGGRYGSTKAWKALNNARKLYQSSGFTRKVEGLDGRVTEEKSMLSIENLVNKGQAKEYAALINALKDTELLTTSTAQNAIRAENRTDSGYGAVNKLQRVTSLYGSFMMHHTERMSREITAVATYDLEMQRLKRDKPNMSEADRQAAAIQEAVRIVQRTHGAVTSTTGTRIGQTSVGKIFMVFKNYAFAQYYNLFSTIFRAFPVKNADPDTLEDIKAARRQLVGMYGMVALFAGVKGVPLYWIAELAYDALRDEEDEDFDALMRRYLGEFLFKGPVNYITNLSIADRVGWTDLIWRENKNDRAGSSAIVQYLESSLAPLSVIKNFEKGANIISETGSWYRGIEAMLPAAFKNPMKALRYGSEGANTLRGDPVMADINVGNAAMQALGFAPADLMNQYEENATLLARQKAIRGNEQRLLKQYYVALKNGDTERAAEVVEKLYELGAKYPELGIGPALLNKSVRERDRFSSKLYHGMRLDDKLRDRLLGASQIEYD